MYMYFGINFLKLAHRGDLGPLHTLRTKDSPRSNARCQAPGPATQPMADEAVPLRTPHFLRVLPSFRPSRSDSLGQHAKPMEGVGCVAGRLALVSQPKPERIRKVPRS